jgi:hypothetical protein
MDKIQQASKLKSMNNNVLSGVIDLMQEQLIEMDIREFAEVSAMIDDAKKKINEACNLAMALAKKG